MRVAGAVIVLLALAATQGTRSLAQGAPTAAITGGTVRGVALADGGAVFQGIPFAQPPVGDLRWREPQPVRAWSGVRDATAFGPRCMQSGNAPSQEDCLYLNVWTAEWPSTTRKPVMLWIHGGGNFAGAASEPVFDGTRLARHGVVLVSANYRLGVFGFLAHPELAAESPHRASGNYGLLDQVAAMRWVRDNIARFGGDPDNVTVFGESAGSLDINMLMASPLTRGLFRRVIGQSGPILSPPSRADGEKKGLGVAASLQAAAGGTTIKHLRALSAAELQKATGQGLSFLGAELGLIVDGHVFDRDPLQVFAEGRQHGVDLMLGSNSRELQRPFFPLRGGLTEAIQDFFGPLAAKALATYGVADGATAPPDPVYGDALAQFATDTQFRCGTVMELVWHAGAGRTAYQYEFARAAPGREAVGAAHAAELPYVFGTLGPTHNDVDRQVASAMQTYWTNFAKTGNPSGGALPPWPRFDPRTRAYLQFSGAGSIGRRDLRRPFCDLFIEHIERSRKTRP